MFAEVEEQVSAALQWLRLLVEALGAGVIGVGVLVVLVGLVRYMFTRGERTLVPIRLAFARYLILALELQLAADILSTSVSPTWDQIGKLSAIAVIRTALNFFLSKELREEGADRRPRDGTPAATDR